MDRIVGSLEMAASIAATEHALRKVIAHQEETIAALRKRCTNQRTELRRLNRTLRANVSVFYNDYKDMQLA